MTLPNFEPHDRGATAVEYAIMASLIAAVIVAIVFALGETVRDDYFQYVVDIVTEAF